MRLNVYIGDTTTLLLMINPRCKKHLVQYIKSIINTTDFVVKPNLSAFVCMHKGKDFCRKYAEYLVITFADTE